MKCFYFFFLSFLLAYCKTIEDKKRLNAEKNDYSDHYSGEKSPFKAVTFKIFDRDEKLNLTQVASANFVFSEFNFPKISDNEPSYLSYFGFIPARLDQNFVLKDLFGKVIIEPNQCGYFAFIKNNQNFFVLPSANSSKDLDVRLFNDPQIKERLIIAGTICLDEKGVLKSIDNSSLHGIFSSNLKMFASFLGDQKNSELQLIPESISYGINVQKIIRNFEEVIAQSELKRVEFSSKIDQSVKKQNTSDLIFGVEKERFQKFIDAIFAVKKEDSLADTNQDFALINRVYLGSGAGGLVEKLIFKSKKPPYDEYAIAIKHPDLSGKEEDQIRQARDLIEESNIMKIMDDFYPDMSENGVKMHFVHHTTVGDKKIPILGIDLIEGSNANERWHSIDSSKKADLLIQMASRIGSFNDAGIIHGDVALRNMLLHNNRSGSIDLRVADYGLTMINADHPSILQKLSNDPLEKARLESFGQTRTLYNLHPMGQSIPEQQILLSATKYQNKKLPSFLDGLDTSPKKVDMQKLDPYSFALEAWSQIFHHVDANTHFVKEINTVVLSSFTDKLKTQNALDKKKIKSKALAKIYRSYLLGEHTAKFLQEIESHPNLSPVLKQMFKDCLNSDSLKRPTMTEMSEIMLREKDDLIVFIQDQKPLLVTLPDNLSHQSSATLDASNYLKESYRGGYKGEDFNGYSQNYSGIEGYNSLEYAQDDF